MVGSKILTDIDWSKPPRTWAIGYFTSSMGIQADEFEVIAKFAEAWLRENVPDGKGFSDDGISKSAREWANSILKNEFSQHFAKIPSNTAWALAAPYGVMTLQWERAKKRLQKTEKQPKTESSDRSSAMASGSTTMTTGIPQESPTPLGSRSLSGRSTSTPTARVAFVCIRFERRSGSDEKHRATDLTLDSFTDFTQAASFESAALLIGTARLDTLKAKLKDQKIVTNTNDLIVAKLDPRGRCTIDNDTNLQEALRYMASYSGLYQIEFFVCPDTISIETLFDDGLASPSLAKRPRYSTFDDGLASPSLAKRPRYSTPPKPQASIESDPASRQTVPEAPLAVEGMQGHQSPTSNEDEGLTHAGSWRPWTSRRPNRFISLNDTDDECRGLGEEQMDIDGESMQDSSEQGSPTVEDESVHDNANVATIKEPRVSGPKLRAIMGGGERVIENDKATMLEGNAGDDEDEEVSESDEEEDEEEDAQGRIIDMLTHNENMKKCEHVDLWDEAARFAKLNPTELFDIPVVKVSGLTIKLWQYQWLGAYVTLKHTLSDKNGSILADEPGLGKTVMTLAVIVIWRMLVVLRRGFNKEWDPDFTGEREHRDRYGKGECQWDKTLSFMCPCDPKSPAYGWNPMDGHFEVLVPPAMLGTWKTEAGKYIEQKPKSLLGEMVVIIAHREIGKHGPSVLKNHQILTGQIPKRPLQGDDDCKMVWSTTQKKRVLGATLSGRYTTGTPKEDSSRYIVVTTYQSWKTNVQAYLTFTYAYFSGKKATKLNTERIYLINPAVVIVDEAHLCTESTSGHYNILRIIQDTCSYKPKAIFLTGTPLTKGPEDLKAMFSILETDAWADPEHPLFRFYHTELDDLINRFKQVTSREDKKLLRITKTLWDILHKVMTRRTTESMWFGKHMKKPVPTTSKTIAVDVPVEYKQYLATFDQTMRRELQRYQQQQLKNSNGKIAAVSLTKIVSTARLYQMASSLPYLTEYWSDARNYNERFRSQDVTRYIDDSGEMTEDCPLYPYIETILKTSPKLAFIGRILDEWQPEDGKLLILSQFVLVSFFTALYVRRHHTRKSSALYHARISRKDREKMVAGFQRVLNPTDEERKRLLYPEWDRDVLAGTFKTMGVGLTLTAADKVILMEPHSDPGVVKQGLSRAVRISQTREVFIVHLRCPSIAIEDRLTRKNSLRAFFATSALEGVDSEGQAGVEGGNQKVPETAEDILKMYAA